MEVAQRTLPAPRKDLNKVVKKKRSSRKPAEMDVDMLIASLTDDTAQLPTTVPVVNYYTYAQAPPPPPPAQYSRAWEPRLLLRQAYKVASEAFAVVGLECGADYGPSIYLINGQVYANLTFEDFISMQSISVVTAVDRFFGEGSRFSTLYLDSVCVEPATNDSGSVVVRNFKRHTNEAPLTTPPSSPPLPLTATGWNALKRLFDCVESYRTVCSEWSPVVQRLVARYGRFFTRRYKELLCDTRKNGSSQQQQLSPEVINHVKTDLPTFLQELDERRLKVAAAAVCDESNYEDDYWTPSTPTTLWIDAEVRRYCASSLIDFVLDNLKYCCTTTR